MRQFSFIKGLIAASLIAVIVLPLYTYFLLQPSFTTLTIKSTEAEAIQLAKHLVKHTSIDQTGLGRILPEDFATNIAQAIIDFNLVKVKVYLATGETIFSTDPADIGFINNKKYFHEEVAKGKIHTNTVTKNTHSLEGQLISRDVVETYVPIEKNGRVLGAFELYYDITDKQQAINLLLKRLNTSLFFIVFGLIAVVTISALRASKKIVNQQQSEEALRTERDFVATLLNAVNAAVIVFDQNLRITFLNRRGEEISGYDLSELQGRHPWDLLLVPEETDKVKAALKAILASKQTSRLDNFWITRTGEKRLLSWSNITLPATASQPGYIISTGIDITESSRTSAMLQQAKEDWETTFDSIDDPITIHDKNMNVIRANAAAREIIGLQTSDIIGQKCYTLYHGTTTAPGNCPSCSTLQSNKPSIAEIFEPHLHKYLEIKTFPRIDSNNKTIGIIHIARDISNRKRAEEKQQILQAQLLQSQKMEAIGQLAGGVAHDFNNLLTGIIGFVGLAKDQVEENSPISADLRETLDLAKRASSLTRQLLAFSRRQILAPEPVNLNDLVIDMSKMLKRLIGEDITLDLRPAGSIFLINADPGQIEQVLVNLTVNSRQAMPSGGALTIATTNVMLDETESILRKVDIPEGSYVMLTVTDTGIGIDQEIQQQIFDPFFTTKEVGIGSGLGLSTVYGIIKQHKGFVWVDSEPGKGATFIIYLPAAETIAAGTKTKMTVRSKESPTILVVEDDVAVLQVTERMLNNLGFSVLTAVSPDEAEKIFSHRTDTISLLLTDVILPTKNGKELYKSLQRIKPSLAILYMSGHTQDTLIQKNILAPDSPFIKKPFSQEDLEQRLTYLTP